MYVCTPYRSKGALCQYAYFPKGAKFAKLEWILANL